MKSIRMRELCGNNDYINLIIIILDDIKSYCVGVGVMPIGSLSCEMPNRGATCYHTWIYAVLSSKYPLYSGYSYKSKIFRKKSPDYLVISIKIPIFVP